MQRDDWEQLCSAAKHGKLGRTQTRMGVSRAEASAIHAAIKAHLAGDEDSAPVADGDKVQQKATAEGLELVGSGSIRTLDGLLSASNVDRGAWTVDKWVANKWDGIVKDADTGGNAVTELWQVKAWLRRKPDWARYAVRPVKHHPRSKARPAPGRLERVLIIPDSQNGYRRQGGELVPLHDRQCWDLAVQVAQRTQPSRIVLLGDMLDLAPWSTRWPLPNELRDTTTASCVELHWWLGQLRMAAPSAQIDYMEGNHEARVSKAMVERLSEAEGVRPADDPHGPPLMSVQRLLALDTIDVTYHGAYPDAELWLWDEVRIHHGTTAKKGGGSTVAGALRGATYSQVFGHVHRAETASRTFHGPGGKRRRIFAATPGTICRIDGTVPAAAPRVDWQQSLMMLTRTPAGAVHEQLLPIDAGALVLHGELLQAADRVADLNRSTGGGF